MLKTMTLFNRYTEKNNVQNLAQLLVSKSRARAVFKMGFEKEGDGFNHSVKVPIQYKKAAAIFKKAKNEKGSVKALAYQQKHRYRTSDQLGLLAKYSEHRHAIEEAIEKTKILAENPRLDPSLGRVLITALLFGSGRLNGESAKPVSYVLSFKEKLQEAIAASSSSKSTQAPKPRYVRINTNLLSLADAFQLLSQEEWKRTGGRFENYDEFLEAIKNMNEDEFIVDMHVPTLLIFRSQWKYYWASHSLVAEKQFMLQDKATCVVSELLRPDPKSVVLDMCAAPGMKTIHLSNLMGNQGTIYAIEMNETRYSLLCKMVTEAKATSVKPIKADVLEITNEDVPDVEYILVDPSCSGSGMQSRISLSDEEKDFSRLRKLAGLQIKILSHAMKSFPKAKRIVYATCSIYEEENEQVVERCLEKCPEFKLLTGKKCLERKWNNVGNKDYKGVGKNCLYALAEKDFTDGIFMAVFERINDLK